MSVCFSSSIGITGFCIFVPPGGCPAGFNLIGGFDMPGEKKSGQQYKRVTKLRRKIRMLDKDIEKKKKNLEMIKRMRSGSPRYISA